MPCPSETRFQAFVEGDLTSHEIAEISQHLDACSECRMLVGLVQPVPLEGDQLADRVGRYVLRRMLGKGGMGIVYEAVDPDLHRVVALKVLRSGLGDMQQRLLGEAEAMAMLSHPNVVTVYDVGRAKDRVFVVMELIRGMSLRTWLARERPTLRAVLDAFAQAGEGLAAAHRAGLVHRDFKPENVFVAGDGRVRVGDFGLAVACGAEAAAGEGSAGYMAPEQQSGQQADARSDQYSFCVALEEAARTSVANRSTGVLRPGVPRWLSRALARGTKANPADRFPSMEALVAALLAGRQRARRWSVGVATAFGAGAVVVGIALGAHRSESQTPAVCRDSDGQVAAVWNPDVAGRLEHVLRASATPIGAGTWRMTDRVLTQYAKQWAEAHRRICDQASRSRGEDTTALFARKVDCLSDRLGILRAVLAGLEQADPTTLEQAPAMLQLLPRLDACEDANRLAQLAPSPPDDKRGAVDAARKRLAEASATIAAGRYQEGLTGANEAWEAANTTGYFPVLAEAYLWVGIAHGRLGHTRESEQALEQAVSSATAGQARDLAVRAWIQLMHFIGFEGKRFDDGYRYADYAKTALDAMPGAVELEVERLAWLRAMLLDQKRYEAALAASTQELALVALRLGGSHHALAVALDGRAGALSGQCKTRDALEPQQKACSILEEELGAPHPQLALCLGNLAGLYAKLGDHARALPIKRRALSMFNLLPGHPNHVGMAHRNLVRSLVALGQTDEAQAELGAALPLSESSPAQVAVTVLRGEIRQRKGETSKAREDFTRAVEMARNAGPSRRLEPLMLLAQANLDLGRLAEAEAAAREAVAATRSSYGEGACQTAEPLGLLAEALLESGRAEQALPVAEGAVAALAEAQLDSRIRAHAEFTIARALPPEGRERAHRLANSALRAARQAPAEEAFAARVERWLALDLAAAAK